MPQNPNKARGRREIPQTAGWILKRVSPKVFFVGGPSFLSGRRNCFRAQLLMRRAGSLTIEFLSCASGHGAGVRLDDSSARSSAYPRCKYRFRSMQLGLKALACRSNISPWRGRLSQNASFRGRAAARNPESTVRQKKALKWTSGSRLRLAPE